MIARLLVIAAMLACFAAEPRVTLLAAAVLITGTAALARLLLARTVFTPRRVRWA